MTDKSDTSPEAVPVDTSTSRIRKLQELGCADYIHAALAAERDTLSARVAELEERCLHLSKGEARLSGLLNERASELAAAEQRAATLEAKLAKVTGALAHEVKRSRRHLAGSTLATLAEIQTETKEQTP